MKQKKRCSRCILSESFPRISFDESGVCSFCRDQTFFQTEDEEIHKAQALVLELFNSRDQTAQYDAVMCYSGGKDSTYTLYRAITEYGLKVLAFTLDNGFIPQETFDNMKCVTDSLGVDLFVLRPSLPHMKRIIKASAMYPIYNKRTLMRISSICNSCISIVNAQALRIALEKKIPFILAGFTLGQIPVNSIVYKNNYLFLEESRGKSLAQLREKAGAWIDDYFCLPENLVNSVKVWPYMINLLCLENISETDILNSITSFGWRGPDNVDGCSSNCQLNTFNNHIHEQVLGYNPYELELSHMIRKGLLDRETALVKVNKSMPAVYKKIAADLSIDQKDLDQVKKDYGSI